ncbi:hypothetical protein CIPAW_14G104100 [Carya illinoinensis]|uniref:Uncharacterized protein n=1 Tax=Carya illinoinensis TaxID=32201 RepID=A0A8T1ND35_CARIL|nr:hypothetical protein CIPAW_14G104100 [Carya illinoinensis]
MATLTKLFAMELVPLLSIIHLNVPNSDLLSQRSYILTTQNYKSQSTVCILKNVRSTTKVACKSLLYSIYLPDPHFGCKTNPNIFKSKSYLLPSPLV